MDAKAEKIALFRYALIASLVLELLPRGELTRRAQEIAARQYEIPASQRTSVSVDTLLEWALRYRRGGLEALAPKPRQDRGQARVIPPKLAQLIERLMRENPHRTGTTLLRELALAEPNSPPLSTSTLYRFLKQRGLTTRQLLVPAARKKFEAERSNQIWQADMLFGPYVQRPGGGKMQVFLHAILDDASRLIPHAQFYTSQGLEACLDCLRQAVAARGLPTRLYMDNAKMYRGQQLARIAASLGILIVHTPPYQPEGRGKQTRLQRFTRRAQFPFFKTIDEFDFSLQITLRQSLLGSYLGPDFVTEGRSLILYGKTGRGKTHLAVAIGYRAIQNGFETFFTTAAKLIEDLSNANQRGRLHEALLAYTHPHVLVIDEVGYLAYGSDAANVLFHVVNHRHLKKRPMIFTTNKPLTQWGKVLHDDDLAAAILDRILERGRLIQLDGPSGRTRHLNLEEALPSNPERLRISGIGGSEFPEPTTYYGIRNLVRAVRRS
jgi:DNA replication protein DnaC/transposase